jgi:hypothetical protein
VGRAYGGSSLFGSRSMSSSPSFGGGINGSGGHAVILCGVFQGTVGAEGVASVVDARRCGAILCRHWWRGRICGRARRTLEVSRGGGIMKTKIGDCAIEAQRGTVGSLSISNDQLKILGGRRSCRFSPTRSHVMWPWPTSTPTPLWGTSVNVWCIHSNALNGTLNITGANTILGVHLLGLLPSYCLLAKNVYLGPQARISLVYVASRTRAFVGLHLGLNSTFIEPWDPSMELHW